MDAATEMYSNLEDNDLMSTRETVQILQEHSFTLAEFASCRMAHGKYYRCAERCHRNRAITQSVALERFQGIYPGQMG